MNIEGGSKCADCRNPIAPLKGVNPHFEEGQGAAFAGQDAPPKSKLN
jgi:hypothetical protein